MKELLLIPILAVISSCSDDRPNSDVKQSKQQETILEEAASQIGMPGIKNFREKRELKQIYEMRDQAVTTYTYVENFPP